MNTLITGSVLPNGAIVIDSNAGHVLANLRGEFVVWTINLKDLSCYWGHYFQNDLSAAVELLASYN